MGIFIDGRLEAKRVQDALKTVVQNLEDPPGLAVICVGHHAPSEIYVRHKMKACESVGIRSWVHNMPAETSEDQILTLIHGLNHDRTVHGILIQLPVPPHLNPAVLIQAMDPFKDVDGLHPQNVGKLMQGHPCLAPCTPQGCVHLLKTVKPVLEGEHVLIVGRSLLVGKPLVPLLLQDNCTVTIAHSKTRHLQGLCQEADILIAAAGVPHLIQGSWIKKGAVVIDVGINRTETGILGDVDTVAALPHVQAITPVPGGVGPMTVAYLLKNTVKSALMVKKQVYL